LVLTADDNTEHAGPQRASRSPAGRAATAEALLVVAAEPPPIFGAAVASGRVLAAGRRGCFRFYHLNVIDPAGASNMGRIVPANVALALKHYAQMAALLVRHRDIAAVYVLLGFTNAPAFWRDIGFLLLARLFRKPTIIHCHDNMVETFYRRRSWPTRRAVRWALHGARAVAVLCAAIESATQRVAPRTRTVVVPNGLDLEPPAAPPPAPRDDVPVVLYLSQLSREKGFWTALRVAARARQEGTQARFEFAGTWKSPADEARARNWVAESGLASTVSIHGRVTEQRKSELLRDADIFLFPTGLRHEGQPLVILEAMAAGLPVITTDIGCIADTVLHGVTGFVVQPDDIDAIVATVKRLVGDTELRRTMGAAGRARYLAHYTDRAFRQRMLELFSSAAPAVLVGTRASDEAMTHPTRT
jgi:glycosyltransferase involved in cell wall biosynthesis